MDPSLPAETQQAAADLDLVEAEISKRATGTTVPCHWVHDAQVVDDARFEASANFCLACCTAAVTVHEGLTVDGGWSTEHDSVPTCETCGTHLWGSLTEYGAEQELDHYKAFGLPPEDWAAVDLAFAAAEGDVKQEIAAMVMAHVRMERAALDPESKARSND